MSAASRAGTAVVLLILFLAALGVMYDIARQVRGWWRKRQYRADLAQEVKQILAEDLETDLRNDVQRFRERHNL